MLLTKILSQNYQIKNWASSKSLALWVAEKTKDIDIATV